MKKGMTIAVFFALLSLGLVFYLFLEKSSTKEQPASGQLHVKEEKAVKNKTMAKIDALTTATSAPNFDVKPVKRGDDMTEIGEFLKAHRMGFLATVDNGKPRIRAFGMMDLQGEKLIFSTSNKKDVFKQLKKEPYAEWIVMDQKTMKTLRVLGEVVFISDNAVKEKLVAGNAMLKKMYSGDRAKELEMFNLYILEANWFGFNRPAQPTGEQKQGQ